MNQQEYQALQDATHELFMKHTPEPNVDVLVGGQWGSEGKGNIVSVIAPRYDVLVRTGGPNAGHQVKMPDGKVFTFHHLPSGSLHNTSAAIVLGPGAVINPDALIREIDTAGISHDRIYIDPQAAVIYQDDIDAEKISLAHIGSTSQGVGHASLRKMMRNAPGWKGTMARDCTKLERYITNIESRTLPNLRILVEGTQGTLLSLHHGQWPYVTSRDTTASGFLSEAGIGPKRVRKVIMVVRSYPIRVQSPDDGTSGPMGEEVTWEDVAREAGLNPAELREKEKTSTTKRQRRVARFNLPYFLRAVKLNSPTDIALTFADYLGNEERILSFADMLQRASDVPVTFISRGFGPEHVWISPTWYQ